MVHPIYYHEKIDACALCAPVEAKSRKRDIRCVLLRNIAILYYAIIYILQYYAIQQQQPPAASERRCQNGTCLENQAERAQTLSMCVLRCVLITQQKRLAAVTTTQRVCLRRTAPVSPSCARWTSARVLNAKQTQNSTRAQHYYQNIVNVFLRLNT
eukprot:COSAG06_NODE_7330_length_2543_cov_126.607494_2_plen_156_part_00